MINLEDSLHSLDVNLGGPPCHQLWWTWDFLPEIYAGVCMFSFENTYPFMLWILDLLSSSSVIIHSLSYRAESGARLGTGGSSYLFFTMFFEVRIPGFITHMLAEAIDLWALTISVMLVDLA